MKTIRKMNAYTNGNDSRVNVYFEDGSRFCHRVTAEESVLAKKEGAPYIEKLMEKYKNEKPAEPMRRELTRDEERYALLQMQKDVIPLTPDEQEEMEQLEDAIYTGTYSVTDRKSLGAYLKREREAQGISVRKMAELARIQPATVQNVENGAFTPRLDVVQKMLEVLGKRLTIQ